MERRLTRTASEAQRGCVRRGEEADAAGLAVGASRDRLRATGGAGIALRNQRIKVGKNWNACNVPSANRPHLKLSQHLREASGSAEFALGAALERVGAAAAARHAERGTGDVLVRARGAHAEESTSTHDWGHGDGMSMQEAEPERTGRRNARCRC
jgi:hypothetical protein